ncbi:bifunctional YncE family protein/alkaline phosphatase family protein [Telluribacter sp.]|jgi:YVTN family beta-propeller protein|uniref:bifunctional YncE family protein/alkaline phosphatase family protein n=1 Tax=Telluribacter sp. TaxID=1978767 RepID=UPI002E0E8318|nr:bifunctional YncE family protein/alkaline phosphatase family protein [Telluribacter sp.]
MKKLLPILLILLSLGACYQKNLTRKALESPLVKELRASRVQLPNGWSLTPVGRSLPLQDLPLNLVVSPTKRYLAVTNNGQSTQSIMLIDARTEAILDDQKITKSWVGLAFSPDERYLYASGGNDNKIVVYQIKDNRLVPDGEIVLDKPWPVKVSPAGLCATNETIYVVAKDNNSLYILDSKTRKVTDRIQLPAEPYTCLLSPDSRQLYISLWGGAKILFFDTEKKIIRTEISTDKNPNDMVLTKDGQYLYVSHGNDNTVSVIDTRKQQKLEVLSCSLYPNAPVGTTPNAVALSDDEEMLLIANADNNCLVVFEVEEKGKSRSRGFIPTGWYPTSVKTIGNKVYVTNGKGFSSYPNPGGPNPVSSRSPQFKGANPEAVRGTQYIGGLLKGTLSIFEFPEDKVLADYSRIVYENTPYNKARETTAEGEKGNPIPTKVGASSPIKYVFYVIKENRTYDQVLGDVPGGNGDTSLCLFPERITPNQHALVKEFVLLDNFYVDAEVSADGHNWSTAAYANDYIEKTWVTSYGGRGGTYDYEGSREIAFPRDGFIWDFAKRAGVTYRSYGEFVEQRAKLPALQNNYCPTFSSYNLSIKDVTRFEQWKADFDSLAAANSIPQLSIIRLGNDHTAGARLGMPTTEAMVADNDLAVGKLVEYLSQSPIWEQTAVFILEDDAQNGSDHVDAHRSTAYLAGGYVKRGYVDHTMYSTSSLLRTIELILGLPPMSQYDAAATPMWRSFAKKPSRQGFTARPNNIDLDQKNVAVNENSIKSGKLDLSKPDLINDLEFSEIVWKAVKGLHSPMPAPKRSAFLVIKEGDDDDE